MNGTAQRIKALREKSGITHVDLAKRLCMNLPSYYDLEDADDELASVAELWQVRELSRVFGVSMLDLIDPESKPAAHIEPVSFSVLASMIQERLSEGSITPNSIGWDVAEFLEAPSIAQEYPLDFVTDVAKALGIDWRALVLAFEKE